MSAPHDTPEMVNAMKARLVGDQRHNRSEDERDEAAAMLHRLHARAISSESEAFCLAATQCEAPVAGEWGHQLCATVEKLRDALAATREDALREVVAKLEQYTLLNQNDRTRMAAGVLISRVKSLISNPQEPQL